MIKGRGWLLTGIASVALLTGLLVGLSNSPVAGVAVTGILGALLAAVGLFKADDFAKKLDGLADTLRKTLPSDTPTTITPLVRELREQFLALPPATGKLLTLFSTVLLAGLLLGSTARLNQHHQARAFPWNNTNAPARIYNALDWIVIQEHLRARGYSQQQVETLYALQVAQWKGTEVEPSAGVLSTHEPLSRLFGTDSAPKKTLNDDIVVWQPPINNNDS